MSAKATQTYENCNLFCHSEGFPSAGGIATMSTIVKTKRLPDRSRRISLHPLSVDEAVKALLRAKPFGDELELPKRKPAKSAKKGGAS